MQISEIQAFVCLARLGHLTRAASELCISQPAMTRRINQLERELGLPLFERLPRGVRLTAAGRSFLPFAQRTIGALHDGAAAARSVDRDDTGAVTLGIVGTLVSTKLPGSLKRFRNSYPEIHVILHTGRSEQISAMVRSGDVDLGLRYFGDGDTEIISTPVHDEPLCVVASADTRLVSVQARRPQELANAPWVLFPAKPATGAEPYARMVTEQLHRHGLSDVQSVLIDSLTAQKRLVEADFGLGLLPESSVLDELRLGTLVKLDVPELATAIPITILHRRMSYLSQAARRLLAEIVSEEFWTSSRRH